MKTKTIIPIAIVAIFVALAFSPAASATQVRVAWVENPDDATTAKFDKVELTDGEYQNLYDVLQSAWTWMMENHPLSDGQLSEAENATINGYINNVKDILADSPLIAALTTEQIVSLLLSGSLTKKCVLAVGWGRSLMPFNEYEWGFSGGTPFIRPLTFMMTLGYTGVLKYRFPLGAMGYDKMGRHLVMVQGLQGLWIDGGSLGWERFFKSGIEFVIGRARVFTVSPIFGSH